MLHPWHGAWANLWGARGLTQLSLSLDAWLWGPTHPGGFHLTSLLLHVTASLAALAAGRSLCKGLPGAVPLFPLMGALLFAVHPLQTGAVAYVVQRAEVLVGLFSFLALFLWLEGRRGWAALAALGGFLSKDNGLTIPGLILAAELARGLPWPRWLPPLALVFAGALGLGILQHPGLFHLAPAADGTAATLSWGSSLSLSPALYALTQLGVLARYLRLTVLPLGQRIDYDWGEDRDLFSTRPLAGLGVLILLAVLAWRLRRRTPLPVFGLAWLLIALAPSSSILPIEDVIMEHRLYTALWGPLLVIGAWAVSRERRWKAPLLTAGACLVLLTAARNATWARPERLWRESARWGPGRCRPWEAWGEILRDRGRLHAAEWALRRAVTNGPYNPYALHKLGRVVDADDRHAEAAVIFRRCLAVQPSHADAALDLGESLRKMGRDADAVPVLQAAVALSPDYAMLQYNLGTALARLGRSAEAVAPLRKAVALVEGPKPQRAPPTPPRAALALVLVRSGHAREATEVLEPLVASHPEIPAAWLAYGEMSAALGDAAGIARAKEMLARIRR